MMVKIGIAADHAGFFQKELLKKRLGSTEYEILDYEAYVENPDDDYPDVVYP